MEKKIAPKTGGFTMFAVSDMDGGPTDTFEHDVYFVHEKPIHLPPIWSPDDGDDDDVRPENLEKVVHWVNQFWTPNRTPKNVQEQPKTGSLFGPIFDPILGSFWRILGAIWAPRLARERSEGA